MHAKHTGPSVLGAAAPVAEELADQILASNRRGGATDPETGERWTWGALVRKLLDAANDYREARDNFDSDGLIAEAEEAELMRKRVIAVYDKLAELYREWPELGLNAEGGLNGPPAIPLLAIAAIIGGAAIWWWAVGQAFQAGRLLLLSRRASDACRDDPNSEQCAQARDDVREAEKTLRESGVNISGGGFGVVGLVAGLGIMFALSRR